MFRHVASVVIAVPSTTNWRFRSLSDRNRRIVRQLGRAPKRQEDPRNRSAPCLFFSIYRKKSSTRKSTILYAKLAKSPVFIARQTNFAESVVFLAVFTFPRSPKIGTKTRRIRHGVIYAVSLKTGKQLLAPHRIPFGLPCGVSLFSQIFRPVFCVFAETGRITVTYKAGEDMRGFSVPLETRATGGSTTKTATCYGAIIATAGRRQIQWSENASGPRRLQ